MMMQSRFQASTARPVARASVRAATVPRTSVKAQALFGFMNKTAEPEVTSKFHTFEVKDIDGKPFRMSSLKGKAVLVVNLASACGFTPQYNELQAVYDKYKKDGLVVLGFPCNQFGAQEPGDNRTIKEFAKSNYGVTFPLMSKVDVNGANADPVFDWLKSQKGGILNSDIKWNFSKFLVDKEGEVVGRYASTANPLSIESDIKKAL